LFFSGPWTPFDFSFPSVLPPPTPGRIRLFPSFGFPGHSPAYIPLLDSLPRQLRLPSLFLLPSRAQVLTLAGGSFFFEKVWSSSDRAEAIDRRPSSTCYHFFLFSYEHRNPPHIFPFFLLSFRAITMSFRWSLLRVPRTSVLPPPFSLSTFLPPSLFFSLRYECLSFLLLIAKLLRAKILWIVPCDSLRERLFRVGFFSYRISVPFLLAGHDSAPVPLRRCPAAAARSRLFVSSVGLILASLFGRVRGGWGATGSLSVAFRGGRSSFAGTKTVITQL